MLSPKPPQNKRYTQTKSEEMEKNISCKWKGKQGGVAIVISNTIDFKIKDIIREKEGHHIMKKGKFQQEDITLVNIYAPNIGAPKQVKQILMNIKGDIKRNIVIVGDFNNSLTSKDRSSRQKIDKETETLNKTLNQMN